MLSYEFFVFYQKYRLSSLWSRFMFWLGMYTNMFMYLVTGQTGNYFFIFLHLTIFTVDVYLDSSTCMSNCFSVCNVQNVHQLCVRTYRVFDFYEQEYTRN